MGDVCTGTGVRDIEGEFPMRRLLDSHVAGAAD